MKKKKQEEPTPTLLAFVVGKMKKKESKNVCYDHTKSTKLLLHHDHTTMEKEIKYVLQV